MLNGCDNFQQWQELEPQQREYAYYTILQDIRKRLDSLERRNWIHNSFALIGGALGGAAVVVGYLATLGRSVGM